MGIGEVSALLTGLAAVLTAAGVGAKGIAELVRALRKERRQREGHDDALEESA
jgi:hypothetical protein